MQSRKQFHRVSANSMLVDNTCHIVTSTALFTHISMGENTPVVNTIELEQHTGRLEVPPGDRGLATRDYPPDLSSL